MVLPPAPDFAAIMLAFLLSGNEMNSVGKQSFLCTRYLNTSGEPGAHAQTLRQTSKHLRVQNRKLRWMMRDQLIKARTTAKQQLATSHNGSKPPQKKKAA
jgi:hypothetical protein